MNICKYVIGPSWQRHNLDQLAQAINFITNWDTMFKELLRQDRLESILCELSTLVKGSPGGLIPSPRSWRKHRLEEEARENS